MATKFKDSINDALRALNDASEIISSANDTVSNADRDIRTTSSEIENARTLLNTAANELKSTQLQLEHISEVEKRREKALESLKEEVATLRQENRDVNNRLQSSEERRNELDRQNTSLMENIAKEKVNHARLLEKEHARHRDTQAEVTRLHSVVSVRDKTIESLRSKSKPGTLNRLIIRPIVNMYNNLTGKLSVDSISAVRVTPGAGWVTLIMSLLAALPLGISLNIFGADSNGNHPDSQPFTIRITDTTRSLPVDTALRFSPNSAIQELIAPTTLAFIYGGPEQSAQNVALLQYYSKLHNKHAWLLKINTVNPIASNDSLLSAEKKALDNLAIGTYAIRGHNTTRNLMRSKIEGATTCSELIDINFQMAIDVVKQLKKRQKHRSGLAGNGQNATSANTGSGHGNSRSDKAGANNHLFSNNMDHCEALIRQLYANSKNSPQLRKQLDDALGPFIDSLPASVEGFIHRDNCWCTECQEKLRVKNQAADPAGTDDTQRNPSAPTPTLPTDNETDCLGC